MANRVLDVYYHSSETRAEKEIQDGSAGDGRKEDKVTDVDVAVESTVYQAQSFRPAERD